MEAEIQENYHEYFHLTSSDQICIEVIQYSFSILIFFLIFKGHLDNSSKRRLDANAPYRKIVKPSISPQFAIAIREVLMLPIMAFYGVIHYQFTRLIMEVSSHLIVKYNLILAHLSVLGRKDSFLLKSKISKTK